VVTITKADYAALWSANFEQKRLDLKGKFQVDPHWQPRSDSLSLEAKQGINVYVTRSKKPYYSADLPNDPHSSRWYKEFR
jgi:hypothetical protein